MLARAPQDETAANNLACLLAEGDADPARLARAEALARGFEEATDPQRLDTLGWVRYRLGRHAAAAALLERALALAPGDAGVALRLGMARHRAGDAARGDALIRGALARDPSLSQAAEARGLLR